MRSLAYLLVLIVSGYAAALPPAPPLTPRVHIDIRYRIEANRNERAAQFKAMMRELAALDFQRDPADQRRGNDNNEISNRAETRLRGTIPTANATRVSRILPVLGVLIRPLGKDLPLADNPVRVELELSGDLTPARQRVAAEELTRVLTRLGYRQPIGYDHANYTHLVGLLPANQLETLLTDLRYSPVAWNQLSKTLLSDLRKFRDGTEAAKDILLAWYENTDAKPLLDAMVEAWVLMEPGYRHLSQLPRAVLRDPSLRGEVVDFIVAKRPLPDDVKARLSDEVRRNEVLREELLTHLMDKDAAIPLLSKLLEDVSKNKSAPLLMEILLRRLEDRPVNLAVPQLFRPRTLIRVVVARPDLPVPESRSPSVVVNPLHLKIGEALRKRLAEANPLRVEIVLAREPEGADDVWTAGLYAMAPSLQIEGRFGPVLTGTVAAKELEKLAALPSVAALRLPREGRHALIRFPDDEGDSAAVRKATALDAWLQRGKPLRPVRVAVIDSDFRGWEALVGKQLPAVTKMVDLTAEQSPILQPSPQAAPVNELGTGTLLAMSTAMGAPWCEMVLVRIDPRAPYQLLHAMKLMQDDVSVTRGLDARRVRLLQLRANLERARRALGKEHEEVMQLFADDKPSEDKTQRDNQERVRQHWDDQAEFLAGEQAVVAQERIYLKHRDDLRELRGTQVAVCGLTWNDSYPVDGTSVFARRLDETHDKRPLWFQPAGNARGQFWTGMFHDADGNGVLEFADANTPLPAGNWTPEMAYLAWQPIKGNRSPAVPGKTRVRATLQWREAQDPEFLMNDEDPFRTPLSDLRLIVLRQLDPEGKTRPADDLVIVEQTSGQPLRLVREAGYSIYEHTVEFVVNDPSRLALRLEGKISTSTRPPGTAELPLSRVEGEVKPRLFLETLEGEGGGRVVMEKYSTETGGYGTPSDAQSAVTVGALLAPGKPQPYSTEGAPYLVELQRKPNLRTYDRLGLEGARKYGGSALSAGYAAGYAATLLGNGVPKADVIRELGNRLRPLKTSP